MELISTIVLLLSTLHLTTGQLIAGQFKFVCRTKADIYIVLTGSATMVDGSILYMDGARVGLTGWFTRTLSDPVDGPQVSVTVYGTAAQESILYGDPLNAQLVRQLGTNDISRLDLGIQTARQSSLMNRRPSVKQYLVIIIADRPLGRGTSDFTNAVGNEILVARRQGFARVTVTTVTFDGTYNAAVFGGMADAGYWVNIDGDFRAFALGANPPPIVPMDQTLWRQYCPEEAATQTATTLPPTTMTMTTLPPPITTTQSPITTLPHITTMQPTTATLPPIPTTQPTTTTLPPITTPQLVATTHAPKTTSRPTTTTVAPIVLEGPATTKLPPITMNQATTTRRPTLTDDPCSFCTLISGVCYKQFNGDCRKFRQCDFAAIALNNVSPEQWTPLGTFWHQPDVTPKHPTDVDCAWDPCRTSSAPWGDERNCAGRWVCEGQRTHGWQCCPRFERWDDTKKSCVPNLLHLSIPDLFECNTLCMENSSDALTACDKFTKPGNPGMFYDRRDPFAVGLSCQDGMIFNVVDCTCIGVPDIPTVCKPILDLSFNGSIKDVSKNNFHIMNVNVVPMLDTNTMEWYGNFDNLFWSQLLVAGFINLDLMENWAIVVDFNTMNNFNRKAALVASTDCDNGRGPYSLALNPNRNYLEAYVCTQNGFSTDNDRNATVTYTTLARGRNRAVYLYRSASGLSLNINGGIPNNVPIAGSMWRRQSLCSFRIGWGPGMDYFTGRIYRVTVYRDPDCIPDNTMA